MDRKASRKHSLVRVFSDSVIIDRAMSTAVTKAIDVHRRAGNKIVVLRNGKLVKIDPRKIPA
jgi:hypothetical protein